MLPEKIECVPPRRLLQATLFDGEDDELTRPQPAAASQCVEPAAASSEASAADQVVVPCLEHGDPDEDLEAMTDDQLRQHVDELRASPDRRGGVILRRLKGVLLLQQRGLTRPRGIQPEHPSAVSPAAQAQNAARMRRRVYRSLRKVASGAGPAAVECLAESLAEAFADASSVPAFRRIAKGLRDGLVNPKVAARAYAIATTRPGIRRPSAFFKRYIADRSPWVTVARARRR